MCACRRTTATFATLWTLFWFNEGLLSDFSVYVHFLLICKYSMWSEQTPMKACVSFLFHLILVIISMVFWPFSIYDSNSIFCVSRLALQIRALFRTVKVVIKLSQAWGLSLFQLQTWETGTESKGIKLSLLRLLIING